MGARKWTVDDVKVLMRDYADTSSADLAKRLGRTLASIYTQARVRGLRKSDAYLNGKTSGRTDGRKGMQTRFRAGHKPWNAGLKGIDTGGRSHETRFKPGQRYGLAAKQHKPIGAERITVEGYRQRKVRDDGPMHKRWQMVHVILWESEHGPVPPNHVVVFRNGDRTDLRVDNLELISRRELMARNTVHNLPPELVEVCQLKGRLVRKINRSTKR